MLRKMRNMLLIGLMLIPLAGGMIACEKEGPAEQAGEKIDEAVESTGDKMKETAEEAGDKIDEAVEKAGDKVEQATD